MSSSDLRSVATGRFQLVEVNDAMPSFLGLLLAVFFFTLRELFLFFEREKIGIIMSRLIFVADLVFLPLHST